MTARQPRRTRRRAAPAQSLPRPSGSVDTEDIASGRAVSGRRGPVHHREHHVTRDYSHVHRDLLTVLVVGTVVLAFIVMMSFVV